MRGSLKLGKIAGIGIYVHISFFLIFIWILYLVQGESDYWSQLVFYIVCYILLFTCVLLHELGHALTAQRYGIQTRRITLLPIGGVAQLEGIPEKPGQELVIAIAGPLVNVAIVILLLPIFLLTGTYSDITDNTASLSFGQNLLATVLFANGILVIFNLIPAFPMDGGRILRALLAKRLDYTKATLIAARTGQVIAVLFILSGVSNWLGLTHWQLGFTLPFIGIFVLIGAQAEYRMVQATHPHSGLFVKDVMQQYFYSVSPKETLKEAVRKISETDRNDIVVTENGKPVGILLRHKLLQYLATNGPDMPVEDAMNANTPTIGPSQPVEHALNIMDNSRLNTLPVVQNSQCVGIITFENIQLTLFHRYNTNIA